MRRTGAWIAFGVGAAGLIGAGIALGVRQSALSDVQSVCPDDRCGSETSYDRIRPSVDSGRAASTLVNVFGAVAIAGVAAGVVLFATSHPPSARSALVLSPTGAAFTRSF